MKWNRIQHENQRCLLCRRCVWTIENFVRFVLAKKNVCLFQRTNNDSRFIFVLQNSSYGLVRIFVSFVGFVYRTHILLWFAIFGSKQNLAFQFFSSSMIVVVECHHYQGNFSNVYTLSFHIWCHVLRKILSFFSNLLSS